MLADRNHRHVHITRLPKPKPHLQGVYFFPEDGCCLITEKAAETTKKQWRRIIETFNPSLLSLANRYAVEYALDALSKLPPFMTSNLQRIESINLNECSIEMLSELFIARMPQSALTHVVANVTNFADAPTGPNSNLNMVRNYVTRKLEADMATLESVLNIATMLRIDFDISIRLSASTFRDIIPLDDAYYMVIRILQMTYSVFPMQSGYFEVRERGDLGEPLMFVRRETAYRGRRNLPMHFYTNVDPRMHTGGGHFRAFDNLTVASHKVMESGLIEDEMESGLLGERGAMLDTEFVLFDDFEMELNDEEMEEHDEIPMWESEVRAYLEKQVFINGFGSEEGTEDALAKTWNAVKYLFEIETLTNNLDLVTAIADLVLLL